MEKALKRMTAAELEQAKPEHLAKRSAMPKYEKRGIRFTDVMVEPGGRYRYDIVTVNGIKAERITMHELNSMLDISTERVRPGISRAGGIHFHTWYKPWSLPGPPSPWQSTR